MATTYAVNEYWGDLMPMMTMEELSECIQAISKLERALNSADDKEIERRKNDLVKEMADVSISLDALRCRYGIRWDDVSRRRKKKLNKKYDKEES